MNAFEASAAAQKNSTNSVMKDRDKLTTQQLLSISNVITITDFSVGSSDRGRYIACTCAEAPKAFFYAGTILTDIIDRWIETFGNGSADKAAEMLRDAGGARFSISSERSKKTGNTYIAWNPISD